MNSYDRLRAFISSNIHGGCKMLSMSDDCICPLCDLDRLRAELEQMKQRCLAYGKDGINVLEENDRLRAELEDEKKKVDYWSRSFANQGSVVGKYIEDLSNERKAWQLYEETNGFVPVEGNILRKMDFDYFRKKVGEK